MRSLIGVLSLLGLLLLCPGVASAEPSATELAVARRLFDEAVQLEGQKRWGDARVKLNEALAIKETPGLRFHLGHCAEQLGEFVAALVEYERALDLVRTGSKAPDVQRLAEPARARVQARVAQLTVRLPADAGEAEVWLDGHKLSPAVVGRPAPVDPGAHQVKVTASGNRAALIDVDLTEGEQRTVHVVLKRSAQGASAPSSATAGPDVEPEAPAKPAPASAPADVDDRPIGTREIVLIGEGSVALVGLGVGIGYAIARNGARDRVEAAQRRVDALAGNNSSGACASADFEGRAACAELTRAIDDYDRAGVIATIGFVGAGVAGAATILTYLLWEPEEEPAVSVGPGPGRAGLAVSGRF